MSRELLDALAPPMINGEAVFEAPWQGRVFGMAHALADAGVFDWDDFRACLIEQIADWDRTGTGEYAYYGHFQRALECLMVRRGIVAPHALDTRTAQLRARPVGHDHHGDHDHDHDHDHEQGHRHGHDHGHHHS